MKCHWILPTTNGPRCGRPATKLTVSAGTFRPHCSEHPTWASPRPEAFIPLTPELEAFFCMTAERFTYRFDDDDYPYDWVSAPIPEDYRAQTK